jgi:hypothetical protein
LTCIHTYKSTESWAEKPSLSYVLSQELNQGDKHSHNTQERNAPKIATHKILNVCCSALGHRLENLGRGTKDRSSTENSRWLQETQVQTHSTTQSENSRHTQTLSVSLQKTIPKPGRNARELRLVAAGQRGGTKEPTNELLELNPSNENRTAGQREREKERNRATG